MPRNLIGQNAWRHTRYGDLANYIPDDLGALAANLDTSLALTSPGNRSSGASFVMRNSNRDLYTSQLNGQQPFTSTTGAPW
jgi:hypothetical protein